MCFRKLYLGFISFLVFSRSGSEVIVLMFIVSGKNPLLTNTSTSSDLMYKDTLLFYSPSALLLVQSNLSFFINETVSLKQENEFYFMKIP